MANGSFNQTTSVDEADLKGMSVVTRSHTHQGSYEKKYVKLLTEPYTHRLRCQTCSAYKIENCSDYYTSQSYHSGDLHYWVRTCVCGRKVTQSWYCSGNLCIEPYSVSPDGETE